MKTETFDLRQHTGYAAAEAKLVEVQEKMTAADRRVQEILNTLSPQPDRKDALTLEAESVLAGGDTKKSTDLASAAMRQDLAQARHEREVMRRALEIQQQAVARYGAEAGAAICERVIPQHRENIEAILRALVNLGEANLREAGLRDRLLAAGISYTAYIPPMAFFQAGDPHDPEGFIAAWLREAYERKLIAAADVPAAWQKAWKERNGFELRLIDEWAKKAPKAAGNKPASTARLDGWMHA